ncbi:MAG: serine/threonine-protein kinase [Gemmatimonadota bacterium]
MTSVTSASRPPQQIGPYRIIQTLGDGGMGVVYEAEETEPVRRRVALKVIRAGLDSRDVLARFDAERRAIAVMNHVGIAKVLHAGSTGDGQPYFAMELVRGLPITSFCDSRRLTLRQRILLFVAVCEAVQHAHQKGVIHRDLKPSNVLVTDEEGRPQPKVIDFGIAKALGPLASDSVTVTLSGLALGTAAYMSPEQADAGSIDVDTRSDIYSMGVMLYELLVGHLPFDPAAVGLYPFLARLIAGDAHPPTPSAGVQTLERERDAIARLRGTDSQHLRRELRGDLDWIVMKAMHPDRTQRYETANALATDLRRHLADEPVAARPPSARYRVGKFVRRHRIGVLTATALACTVVASAVVATVGLARATRAEQRAEEEAEAAQRVTAFLVDLFRVSDPGEARGNTLTAREILDRGTRRVSTELSGQPAMRARIMQTMGTVHAALGQYAQARSILDDVLQIREREHGPSHPLVGETLAALGDVARARGDHAEADRFLQRALAIRQAAFGTEHIDVASTISQLATLRARQGRSAEAESLYRQALVLDARVRRPEDLRTGRDMRGLGAVYLAQKRYAEAESVWKETLSLQERLLGSDHPDVGSTLNNLGGLYWTLGRFQDALPYYERARPILEASLGPAHPTTASVINNLAEVHWKTGRFAQADSLFRHALLLKEQALAPGNPSIAITLHGMAGLRTDEGRFREAEPLFKRALQIREGALGAVHPDVAETLREYAGMLRRAGRAGEAAILDTRASGIRVP